MEFLTTTLGRLRLVAFIEGTSFLLILFITMPLKYLFEAPEPNLVVGMAHGVFFILYIAAVLHITFEEHWKGKRVALALLASIIPFGTFWADKKIFREGN